MSTNYLLHLQTSSKTLSMANVKSSERILELIKMDRKPHWEAVVLLDFGDEIRLLAAKFRVESAASLQVSPSVLGKLVGSIKVDIDRSDIGLNLKRNGQYQLLGYAHRIDFTEGSDNKRKVWTGSDTIQIVGTVTEASEQAAAEADGSYWEYSARAAALIFDYRARFTKLFYALERLPHQSVYPADQLFDGDGKNQVAEVSSWLAAQPFFKMPRTPFTTTSLCK